MKKLMIAVLASSILGVGVVALSLSGSDRAVAQATGRRVAPPPAGVRHPPTKTPPAAACGGDGQPHCPLQQWMEDNVTPAVEAGDNAALAAALTKIATFAPDPSWNAGATSWRGISEAAATKARNGDFRGARAACKQCHEAFRERYRTEFRTRPVPR